MKSKQQKINKPARKRIRFREIFARYLLIGIIVVIILSTISITACLEYQRLLFFRDINVDFTAMEAEINKKVKEKPLNDIIGSIAYIVCTFSRCHSDNINSYIAIKDCETDEYITDSSYKAFLITDAVSESGSIYYNDALNWSDYFNKYHPENIHYFYTVFGNSVYTEYSVVDAYFKDQRFMPGKLQATVCSSPYYGLDNTTILDEYITDLTPENTEGYTYVHFSEDMGKIFTIQGNELTSFESARTLAKSSAYNLCGTTKDNRCYYSQFSSFTDAAGHKYEILSYYEHKYSLLKLNSINFTILVTIYAVIMLIVVWILAVLTNNKNKYFYMTEDYRINLINNLAHDLKSPLMAMGGYAENLKENVHTEKREYYADAIIENAGYMNTIISDTLELSRLDCHDISLKKEHVDLCLLSKSIMDNYSAIIEEKGINTEITGNYTIDADVKEITRALDNLISNAVKYTKIGGKIRICADSDGFKIENDSSEEIPQNIDNLWSAFVKGNESRQGRQGSGLGLTITKRILDMHNIYSELKYEEGKFSVSLLIR
ncbi:MAG: sensor histidine kinase [Lachnospiraceae bacterium]